MTTIETTTLSRERARELTDEVRQDVLSVWAKVLELYEGGAHLALDYGSWREYWEAEFGDSPSRGFQMVRVGRVARLLQENDMPIPTYSVARELAPLLREPERLPDVWGQAVELGKPSAKQVAELVAVHRVKRNQKPSTVRRSRNKVTAPITSAMASALSARDSVKEALATRPEQETLDTWLNTLDETRKLLGEIAREIQMHVSKT